MFTADGISFNFNEKSPSSFVTTEIRPADMLTCRKGSPVFWSTTTPLTTTCWAIIASGASNMSMSTSLFIVVLCLGSAAKIIKK